MIFQEAFKKARQGEQISLPNWDGCWYISQVDEKLYLKMPEKDPVLVNEDEDWVTLIEYTFRDDWEIYQAPDPIEIDETSPEWVATQGFHPEFKRVLRLGDQNPDVKRLQQLLKQAGYELKVDGVFGPQTYNTVIAFQQKSGLLVDGVVGEKTLGALLTGQVNERTLGQQNILWAARHLKVEPAAIMAVSEVESRGSGFFSNQRPAILYERHIMRRRLIHHGFNPNYYIEAYPSLVNRRAGGYIGGVREYDRLEKAMTFDAASAMESCSWGAYQIMGFHWKHLGYQSVNDFVDQMHEGEAEHLKAFVYFIEKDPVLHRSLASKDWLTFARRYNGPAAVEMNQYDSKMAKAYLGKPSEFKQLV